MSELTGRHVSHYQITQKLGVGGMGEVYLATDTKLNRRVALKFLPETLSRDPESRSRLLREAQMASQLNHPNILTVHAIEEADGRDFIVMEYVEGQPLNEFGRNRQESPREILDIAIQVAVGLDRAHREGMVHRDIKPSNILVDVEGRVRILDFGLAKLTGAVKLTQTGSTLGTAGYMSPEQAQGQTVDRRTDLWSLGVVIYEMVTSHLPFSGDHQAALAYAIVHEPPQPLSRYRPDLPEEWQRIIGRCLMKRPEERYQSAAELLTDLRLLRRTLPQTGEAAKAGMPSLAVLPFVNMSADRDNEYFSDGLSEELISTMSKIPGLKVVSRTSAFQFKGKEQDVRRIGEQLNVRTVLEGSVRQSGKRLRVTAQLINVADGFHLWTEKYDREMADVFAIQDEIAQRIAEALKVTLVGPETSHPPVRHAANVEAYTLYLQGRHLWNKRVGSEMKRAIPYFERAIALDPEYALAYTGLADCYSLLSDYADAVPHEVNPKAKAAALRALELDPDLAEAHSALGLVLFSYDWDFEAAAREFQRAIVLNPGYASAHHWYACQLVCLGQIEESDVEIRKARELDPLSPAIATAQAAWMMHRGKIQQAIDELQGLLTLWPDSMHCLIWLAITYVMQGSLTEGVGLLEKAVASSPNYFDYSVYLGWAYGKAGRTDQAREVLRRMLEGSTEHYIQPYSIAIVYAVLGESDAAFEWLEKAYAERSDYLVWLKAHPFFDDLRADPRFGDILRRMGLEK